LRQFIGSLIQTLSKIKTPAGETEVFKNLLPGSLVLRILFNPDFKAVFSDIGCNSQVLDQNEKKLIDIRF
jgi:hypothetical protein